ncbi:MAG TPA: CaiB/BaiF CoA-transferase family protein [Thermoplasmata archaeon]|nr:CaiB/BaiF CoA-transferase family protein [Thermoplasmata archaeon]
MPGPLDGLLVLDLTRLLPGSFATQLLTNLGADVIKIEEPVVGDYMRAVPPSVRGVSLPFLMVNRGKRSLAVDLKRPEGQEIFHRLAARADVLVEQFRPGVMARLGADHPSLAEINPRLVYCSFTGYGQTGPARDWPGHDITFEAHSGILGVTGGADGRPVVPGVPIADLASGFNAALAILAALRTRDRTGRGEFIDVSIFDTTVALMLLNIAHFLGAREEPSPGETILTGVFPFYNLYETEDGRWLAVGAVEGKFWRRLCELLSLPRLADVQFGDVEARRRVTEAVAAAFRTKTGAEWERLLASEDLPVALVRRVSEVVEDPHVAARGLLAAADVPGGDGTRVVRHPAFHEISKISTPTRAPEKGEHSEQILAWLGYSKAAIESLRRGRVVAP